MNQLTDRRKKVVVGIFGVDAGFNRVAAHGEFFLPERQGLTGGDAQLPFDKVEAGDHFGDRVFDLQARVHLHEVEVAVVIEQKFDSARADVADRARGIAGRFAEGFSLRNRDQGCGGFFDHLLMAALHRAVALKDADDVFVSVAEDLDFNMARRHDIFFEKHGIVAE